MTDIDTSPEAVERVIVNVVRGLTHTPLDAQLEALLRQLAKEKAEAYWNGYEAGKTEGQQLARLNGHCDAAIHEARNAALREAAKIADAKAKEADIMARASYTSTDEISCRGQEERPQKK